MIALNTLPNRIWIMGTQIVPFGSYAQATEYVQGKVIDRSKAFCVAINPEKVYRANRDLRLLNILGNAEMGICDGIGVALAARILLGRKIKRCTGCDLFFHLIAAAAAKGWRVFLLGASPQSNALASANLRLRYPGLRLVGCHDGYFEDSAEVVDEINASRPDLLFVALGSPKQEIWISEHREAITAPLVMGVGGTFDVISGKAKRAPRIFQKTGTEFIFRLLCDPRRWRRHLALLGFVLDVLYCRVRGRKASPSGERAKRVYAAVGNSPLRKKEQREHPRSFRVSPLARK